MVIAALVSFAVLLAAWVIAPAEPSLTVAEPLSEVPVAEAA